MEKDTDRDTFVLGAVALRSATARRFMVDYSGGKNIDLPSLRAKEERTDSKGNWHIVGLIRVQCRWQLHLSASHLRQQSIGQRCHRPFAQGQKAGCGVHGEVLADVQVDVQSIGEKRGGLFCLSEHLIGHLLLEVGIAALDDGGPREVVAVGKQICISIQSNRNEITV